MIRRSILGNNGVMDDRPVVRRLIEAAYQYIQYSPHYAEVFHEGSGRIRVHGGQVPGRCGVLLWILESGVEVPDFVGGARGAVPDVELGFVGGVAARGGRGICRFRG